MRLTSKLISAALACFALFGVIPQAAADDSEVFTNSAFLGGTVRPNVLFIIDTSGSMDTVVNSYDPATDYSSFYGCPATDRVYWSTSNSATPPDCKTSTQWITADNNVCRAAFTGMTASGWWNGRAQQMASRSPFYWQNLVAGVDAKVECQTDSGVHGDRPGRQPAGSENKYARNGTGTSQSDRYGNSGSSSQIDWRTKQRYSLYSPNYIAWFYGSGTSTRKTRLSIVRDVANTLISSLDGVNLGLMRYDSNAEGGMVTYPVSELTTTARADMTALLNGYTAGGNTPLSETMYEAYQYFSGGDVVYGNGSSPVRSVAASRVGGRAISTQYDSPMDFSCQNNFIVYLTDGLPTDDNSADTAIQALPNFTTDGGGACPARIDDPDPSWPTAGRCFENLTRYMHNHDMRPDNEVIGKQTVTTYVVGFGDSIGASADFLDKVATAGGGKAYTQTDAAGLTGALEEIFNQVQESADTTIVAPTIAVNAFNRTQNLNQLFVSVFQPSTKKHWPGNLKKYKFIENKIVGVGNRPAVDPATGFFYDYIKSWNTPSGDPADGARAKDGGSAARINSSTRKLYTYLGSNSDLTASENAVVTGNAGITDAMMGAADATERDAIIQFARGLDTNDENEDGITTTERKAMGDPMHARPAVVIYGGTVDSPIGTVFTPTNDGYLHAFDMATGDELWSFLPQEFLARQAQLFDNPPMANRDYGLDGDVRVWKKDTDFDGVVEPNSPDNDKVYILFGTGRGGQSYYAIDVTSRQSPVFKWRKTRGDAGYAKLGYTWSAPELTKIKVGSTVTDVMVVGGGYDTNQEGYSYSSADGSGNAIYIVNLETGAVIWSASNTGASLNDSRMVHSIPSNIAVMDNDNDGLADRMYASDLGGRVWRFDIINGQTGTNLVKGGVFARLGGESYGTPTNAQNRRMYNTPDPVLISFRNTPTFINVAVGTGYRGHPLYTANQDRFYSVRDFDVWNVRATSDYTDAKAVTESNLLDITTQLASQQGGIAPSARGWMIRMTGTGEKVLAESVTVGNVVIFPTFTPLDPDPAKPCLARTSNKVYAVYALNGNAAIRWNDASTGALGVNDRATDINTGGIAPPLSIFADPLGSVANGGVVSGSSSSGSSTGSSSGSTSSGSTSSGSTSSGSTSSGSTSSGSTSSGGSSGAFTGLDSDGDGTPDATDTDDDNDGTPDASDSDANGNGIPDADEKHGDDESNCLFAMASMTHCPRIGDIQRSFWEHR